VQASGVVAVEAGRKVDLRNPMLEQVRDAFAERVAGVLELLEFDTLVIDHLVGGLDSIAGDLEQRNHHSAAQSVRNRLQALKNIRTTNSLRHAYGTIYNQCVVLLVSYFDAAMGDLFRAAIADGLKRGCALPAAERRVELSWRNLHESEPSPETLFAQSILDVDDISFQDMKSIRRAFTKNVGVDLGRDETANNIILGQAVRNLLAHAGGIVDERFRGQVSGAFPRTLKPSQPEVGPIQFQPDEVRILAAAMNRFVDHSVTCCRAKWPVE
jgi:hypothetical protein